MAESPRPPTRSDEMRLLRHIGELWVTYLKGQFLVALLMGSIIWVVGSAIGLSGAFWLGLVAGLLQTVPAIGPLVAVVPAAVVALVDGSSVIPLQNWAFALIVIGVYVAIQQISAFFIEPRLLGKRLDLPAWVVLLAVLAGGIVANVFGAYLAVPLLVTLREIIRYTRAKARGEDPFAEKEDAAPPIDAA